MTVYYQAVAKVFNEATILIVTTTSALKLDHRLGENQKFKPFIGILDEKEDALLCQSSFKKSFSRNWISKSIQLFVQDELIESFMKEDELLKYQSEFEIPTIAKTAYLCGKKKKYKNN